MNKPKLTLNDFQAAAKKLNTGVAEIRAVAEVESRGEAFYSDGFPVLLFERHVFHRQTDGRFDKKYPEISNAKPGGYGRAGTNQRRKFNLAFSLDKEAAMKSASFGKFQIVGFNYEVCGFSSVGKFVDAMKESEAAQLHAFVNFVIGNNLAGYLRNHNWAKFAAGYNGADYKKNDYDVKLANAYRKFSKQISTIGASIADKAENTVSGSFVIPSESETDNAPSSVFGNENSSNTSAGVENTAKTTIESADGRNAATVTSTKLNEQSVSDTEMIPNSEKYNEKGFFATIKADFYKLFGLNATVQTVAEYGQTAQNTVPPSLLEKLAYIVAVGSICYLIFRVVHYLVDQWRKKEREKLIAEINTDVSRKNVEFTG